MRANAGIISFLAAHFSATSRVEKDGTRSAGMPRRVRNAGSPFRFSPENCHARLPPNFSLLLHSVCKITLQCYSKVRSKADIDNRSREIASCTSRRVNEIRLYR
jgi:hypothetical protein